MSQVFDDSQRKRLLSRLSKVGISSGSDDAIVLRDTLVPCLESLLNNTSSTSAEEGNHEVGGGTSIRHDMNSIKHAFNNLIKALSEENSPLLLCIDDLQWADDASLQLIRGLLKDKTLKSTLFIGMYRSNEVDEDHELTKIMQEVETCRGTEFVSRIKIFNLSPESVLEFIADSIDREPQDVGPVAEAVYTKTLGNIFFVKQAIEELVRKNALYYDMMMFEWQFSDVSQVEMEKCLSDDVIKMVKAKLLTLPEMLQRALALAAYTKNDFDLDLLSGLCAKDSVTKDLVELEHTMKQANVEGLVLTDLANRKPNSHHRGNKSYRFAHDRIREAACASIPEGTERDKVLVHISKVLLQRGSPEKDDWMLFVAARHLNSVPVNLTDAIDVAALNLAVGKIAYSKGAFREAVVFLRSGVERLDSSSCWNDHHELTLDLKSTLMETENFLGNQEKTLDISEEIVANARTLAEKSRAHIACVAATAKKSEFSLAVDKAAQILKIHGIHVPKRSPTKIQVRREKARLTLALRGRSLVCLSKFPIASDEIVETKMKLVQMLTIYAHFQKQANLPTMLGHRMLREGLKKRAITKDFPFVLVLLASPLRQQEKYNAAFSYANAAIALMARFPEERGLEFLKGKMALYASLRCLRSPFRDDIETFFDLNKQLLSKGENGSGLGAGMLAMYCFLDASLPLSSLLEPKLLLFEEAASEVGIKSFVLVFRMIRQCLYNLQGCLNASFVPTDLNGSAFNEETVMPELGGETARMTFRDISIIRLQLAVIFDSETVMDEMLDRLDKYPVDDLAIVRQHIRMSYVGFASLILK